MCFVGYTAVMAVLDRRMRRAGGPGIIPFELSGSAFRAEHIVAAWGDRGRHAARWSLWLDFGYVLRYGTLTALLVDRVRRRRGHPPALTAVVAPAVAADAIEGLSLLRVLAGRDIAMYARSAQIAAIAKFAVLGSSVG